MSSTKIAADSEGTARAPRMKPPALAAQGYWWTVLLRGAVALLVTLQITFSSDHSAAVGHAAFAVFALVSGAALLLGAWLLRREALAWTQALNGVLTLAAGVVVLFLSTDEGIAPFLLLAVIWAAATSLAELLPGLALRGRSVLARDWVSAGALSGLLAIGMLVIDPALEHHYVVTDSKLPPSEHVLSGDIVAVGVLGFYTALLGVYLVIAAISLRFPQRAGAASEEKTGGEKAGQEKTGGKTAAAGSAS